MSRGSFPSCSLCLSLAFLVLPGCTASEEPPAQTRAAAIELGPGKLKPLSEVMAQARRIVPGKVIDVELESDIGLDDDNREPRWVYEIEVLTEDYRVVELEFDAVTGQLLEIEGAPWPADIPQGQP